MSFDHPVVLFDLDGTISDNSTGIVACMRHALAALELPEPTDATLRASIGPPLREAFVSFDLDDSAADRAVELYRERYHDVGWRENVLYAGSADLIAALSAAGRRVATATSKPEISATKILDHFGITPHLEVIGAASLDRSRSSKEAVVRHALDRLGAPGHDAVIVGDRHHDVVGARAAGVEASIGVTWGFAEPGELTAAGATAIVDTFDELATTLGLG